MDNEAIKRMKEKGLRKVWKTQKAKILKKLEDGQTKDTKEEFEKAKRIFKHDLGEKLDKYYDELKKFPKFSDDKLDKYIFEAKAVAKHYVSELSDIRFPTGNKIVPETKMLLSQFVSEMEKDRAWYKKHLPNA